MRHAHLEMFIFEQPLIQTKKVAMKQGFGKRLPPWPCLSQDVGKPLGKALRGKLAIGIQHRLQIPGIHDIVYRLIKRRPKRVKMTERQSQSGRHGMPPKTGDQPGMTGRQLSDEALEENARMLESVLDDYGVKGEIVSVRPGPVVTMYELEPAPGLKASRVIGLADDIARSMSALSARVSTVPGRSVIGIELPNVNREKVVLREILSSRDFGDGNQKLPLALGKDISGEPVVANLAKMPHLLDRKSVV